MSCILPLQSQLLEKSQYIDIALSLRRRPRAWSWNLWFVGLRVGIASGYPDTSTYLASSLIERVLLCLQCPINHNFSDVKKAFSRAVALPSVFRQCADSFSTVKATKDPSHRNVIHQHRPSIDSLPIPIPSTCEGLFCSPYHTIRQP